MGILVESYRVEVKEVQEDSLQVPHTSAELRFTVQVAEFIRLVPNHRCRRLFRDLLELSRCEVVGQMRPWVGSWPT